MTGEPPDTGPAEWNGHAGGQELTADQIPAVIATTADTEVWDLEPLLPPDEWDEAALATLHDDDTEAVHVLPPGDLRFAPYPAQVAAAARGDAAVFTLPPLTQQRIEQLSHALAVMCHLAGRAWPPGTPRHVITGDTPARAAIARRAAAILTHSGDGTPFRCCKCGRVYEGLGGEPDWSIAGREDTTCPVCTMTAPRHAPKAPAPPKPAAKAPAAGRRRAARKPPAPKGGTP